MSSANSAKEIPPARKYHGKRVKLTRVVEAEHLSIERHELSERIGKAGIADALRFDDELDEWVSVLFDDGMRLYCLLEELEICDANVEFTATHLGPTFPTNNVEPASPRFAQACITHISFPKSLAELGLLIQGLDTDMEGVVWSRSEESGGGWTTPRWITEGDILFFYHTLSAWHRIKRLIREAEGPENAAWKSLSNLDCVIDALYEQLVIAERYSGTIFACALISGNAYLLDDEDVVEGSSRHWKGRIHAPYSKVCVFARPIPDYAFSKIIPICRGAATTPVHGNAFAELKELIGKHNQLPDYLLNAKPGGVSFRDVDSTNWIEISCSPDARFIDESQLREYLIDFLLEEIKDIRTPVYEECRCDHDEKRPSYADYCIKVHGRWIVVEAKLNVRAEQDLCGQITKYLKIDEFCPRTGPRSGEPIKGPTYSTCVVVDAVGICLMNGAGFVGCGSDRPLWQIKEMTKQTILEIRDRLQFLSAS